MAMWAIVAVLLGIYALVIGNNDFLIYAVIAAGSAFLCMVVNFILCGRLKCPLCMMPPLQNRRCSKHRTATRFLGSHRLKVALKILFAGHFRCPYCGEPTAMQVRQRGGR